MLLGNHVSTSVDESVTRMCGRGTDGLNVSYNEFVHSGNKYNMAAYRNFHFLTFHKNKGAGGVEIGPRCGTQGAFKYEMGRHAIIDSNLLYNPEITIKSGVKGVRISNNILHSTTAMPFAELATMLSVRGSGGSYEAPERVAIVHNTFSTNRYWLPANGVPDSNFVSLRTHVENTVQLVNNLFFARAYDYVNDNRSVPILGPSGTASNIGVSAHNLFALPSDAAERAYNHDDGVFQAAIGFSSWASMMKFSGCAFSAGCEFRVQPADANLFSTSVYSDPEYHRPRGDLTKISQAMNLFRPPSGSGIRTYGVVTDFEGNPRSASAATWTPGALNATAASGQTGGSTGGSTGGTTTNLNCPTATGNVVSRLDLINADTDQVISSIALPLVSAGSTSSTLTLSLSNLPTRNLSIRACVGSSTTKVTFRHNFPEIANPRTEAAAPLALAADNNEDYYAWSARAGTFYVEVTPTTATGSNRTVRRTNIKFN